MEGLRSAVLIGVLLVAGGALAARTRIPTALVLLLSVPHLIRAVDRRPSQRSLRVPIRQRSVIAWAGFCGAVSLAAALALPEDSRCGTTSSPWLWSSSS